jgi:K+-transporting ATPase ATPase C chain
MKAQLRPAIMTLLLFTLITGVVYPLLVSGVAKVAFAHKAAGSSELIGQSFDDPKYFWGRLSATSPVPYNAAAGSGSNLAPSNPALLEMVKARIDALNAADPGNSQAIPVDLVTASGSGLDPHISPPAAQYQAARVARIRGMSEQSVRELIVRHTQSRQLGILGEPRVNVLSLNLELDRAK